jgi:dihydrodipicolinate synthase/N-acetylneuraminate lyase
LGVPALKHVMDRLGFYGGPVRAPLLPLTAEQRKQVDVIYAPFY